MKNFCHLLGLYFRTTYGFNRLWHNKKRDGKFGAVMLGVLYLAIAVAAGTMAYFLSWAVGEGTNALGQPQAILAMNMMAASMMCLMTSIYKVSGTLYAFRDYDATMSLPVKIRTVVASRMAILYMLNALFTFSLMIPAAFVYARYAQGSAAFYTAYFFMMLTVPFLPIVAASLIGLLISRISQKFYGAKYVKLLLMLVFMLAYFYVCMRINTISDDEMFAAIANLVQLIGRAYWPAVLFSDALSQMNWPLIVAFIAGSTALIGLFCLAYAHFFKSVNTAMSDMRTGRKFRMTQLRESSPIRAMFRREVSRYFSSTVYVFNTGCFMLMSLVGVIVVAFIGGDNVKNMLDIPQAREVIDKFLPYVVTLFVAVSATTGCSISMEGKNLWIAMTMPVRATQYLFSKLLLNLVICVPISLIDALVLSIVFQAHGLTLLLIFVMPLMMAVFIALVGLIANLIFHRFDWTNEAMVVKQSLAVTITVLLGMAIVALAGYLTFQAENPLLVSGCFTAFLALAAVVMGIIVTKNSEWWVRRLNA